MTRYSFATSRQCLLELSGQRCARLLRSLKTFDGDPLEAGMPGVRPVAQVWYCPSCDGPLASLQSENPSSDHHQ